MFRLLLLAAALALAGCGDNTAPTTAPAPAVKLPAEVEFDPVTATEKYQKKIKTRP